MRPQGATLVEWAALAIKVFKMWQEEKTAGHTEIESIEAMMIICKSMASPEQAILGS